MNDGKKEHGVGELAVEPQVLVERQPAHFGPDPAHDGAAHGQEDEHGVDAEDEAGAARDPDRIPQRVERRQPGVDGLFVPGLFSLVDRRQTEGHREQQPTHQP